MHKLLVYSSHDSQNILLISMNKSSIRNIHAIANIANNTFLRRNLNIISMYKTLLNEIILFQEQEFYVHGDAIARLFTRRQGGRSRHKP